MVDIYALDMDKIKAHLQAHQVFSSLSTEALLKICEDTSLDSFEKNECLIKEGEESPFLYLIIDGTVDVRSYGVNVARCMAGNIVGEVSASGLSVATAEVVASSRVDTISLPVVSVNRLANEVPAFNQTLNDAAMSRLLS